MNEPPPASPFRTPQERAEERARKREVLLVAAVRMFNERGFHATSLDDVAASVGVTKPVIYHYLGNKDQVLFECVRIGLAQLTAATHAAREQPGTGLDRLRQFLRRYAEANMADFSRCVIRTGDEALSPESAAQFRALKSELDRAMRAMLAEAAADGSARVDDIWLTAFTFAGALNWPARWHRPDGRLSPAQIAERMVDLLVEGIAA
ncbi:TetR/AcrR family transcriptional regulator [Sphingomonas profundi]|uniref:TetR/AcrR family transcriptional regulator n=1 Tax=Alterirhizorhabdus profundi TaxID=2681549 RepID=UPI0012E84D58|nr:TetR/AcrR family transcriptional regulator [Sphingomonas profundi]